MARPVRVVAFSCGSEWADWESRNCARCKLGDFEHEAAEMPCDIQVALSRASLLDGKIDVDIARRCGLLDSAATAITWDCPERQDVEVSRG